MPELPEVEHAARSLRRWLADGPIVRAWAGPTRLLRGGDHRLFARKLRGRSIVSVERRGKLLLLSFDEDVGLLCHLGMTGKWVRSLDPGPAELPQRPRAKRPKSAPAPAAPPHSHARLELRGGAVLHYCDPRLFGRLEVHPASELLGLSVVSSLGPDPLVDRIVVAALHDKLSRTARPVKVAIMDQTVLAGVGNIYATEALFRAKIHPARPSSSLSKREIGRLGEAIVATIALALKRREEDMTYLSEGAENRFLIYDRAGEACPECRRGTLEKITLGGRTSTYCARCQPAR